MSDSDQSSTPIANDYDEHNQTFELFINLLKWGIGATTVVLILMAIFLL